MKYYCIKQHDITDCGAACLATISKHYGLSTSITKIREVAGTDKMGTNAYGIVKAAEQLGFTAIGIVLAIRHREKKRTTAAIIFCIIGIVCGIISHIIAIMAIQSLLG